MARRWGWIAENPCSEVTVPKIMHKDPDVWTPEESRRFLAVAERHSMHPYWALAMETGARMSELLGLTWADLDLERDTLRIGRRAVRLLKGRPFLKDGAKTSAGQRTIRLTARMCVTLRDHQRRQSERRHGAKAWQVHDLIFATATGRPVNPGMFASCLIASSSKLASNASPRTACARVTSRR